MSKPLSLLFIGTKGALAFLDNAEEIIALRTLGLDLSEHPITQKQPSAKQRKALAKKIKDRTATQEEYRRYMWDKRFRHRRQDGVEAFWRQERDRLLQGKKATRQWSLEQRAKILAGKTPKHRGKSIQAHHTYSARLYPHLANLGEIRFPATHLEHFKGWHGGNYKKSLPGRRIKRIREF